MIRFENQCHLMDGTLNDDGTTGKMFPAGSTADESTLPKAWVANAIQRGAATRIPEAGDEPTTVTVDEPAAAS
jgi:hypothetical protein